MFNPFGGDKVKNLVNKIVERSSVTVVAYHNPKFNNFFPQENLRHKITWNHFGMYREVCDIYIFGSPH